MLEGLSLMTVISPALRSQWSEVQYLSFNRNKNTKDRDTITLTLTLSLGVNVEGTVNVYFSVNVNLINSVQGIKPPKLTFCRSLTKVKFSTDQVRPALGSGS